MRIPDDRLLWIYRRMLLSRYFEEKAETLHRQRKIAGALHTGVGEVKRKGAGVTVVATGWMLHQALEAAAQLEAAGVDAEVLDPRTLKPLDTALILTSVRKTGRLAWVTGEPTTWERSTRLRGSFGRTAPHGQAGCACEFC